MEYNDTFQSGIIPMPTARHLCNVTLILKFNSLQLNRFKPPLEILENLGNKEDGKWATAQRKRAAKISKMREGERERERV